MERKDCAITKENLNLAAHKNLIRLAGWLHIYTDMPMSKKSLVKAIWYKLKRESLCQKKNINV